MKIGDPSSWPQYVMDRGGGQAPDYIPIRKARTDEEAWAYAWQCDAPSGLRIYRVSYEEIEQPKG